jgi:hypothetical protein
MAVVSLSSSSFFCLSVCLSVCLCACLHTFDVLIYYFKENYKKQDLVLNIALVVPVIIMFAEM